MSDRCGTSIIRKTLLSERNRIGSEENKRLDHDTSYVRFYKFSRSVSGFKIGWGEYSQAKCEFFFTPSTSLLLKSSIYRPNPIKITVLLQYRVGKCLSLNELINLINITHIISYYSNKGRIIFYFLLLFLLIFLAGDCKQFLSLFLEFKITKRRLKLET